MSQTLQYAVCQHLLGVLQAAPALGGTPVRIGRRRPMPDGVSSQVSVYYDESRPGSGGPSSLTATMWSTRVRVECTARDASGIPAETAADALVSAVFARVMAEQTCGGLAIKIDAAGIAADGDEADTALCAMHALFDVVHRTPRTSITHTP